RYLTDAQQSELQEWRFQSQMGRLDTSGITDSVSLLAIAAWNAYDLNPQHKAWLIDDYLQRHHQWIWRSADHADAAQGATPPSSSRFSSSTTARPSWSSSLAAEKS